MKPAQPIATRFAAVLIAMSMVCVACTPRSPPQDEWAFTSADDPALAHNLANIERRPGIADIDWRQFREAIVGAENSVSMEVGDFPDQAAVDQALAYSRKHQGKGILIWHRGILVGADFADGFSKETPFAAYSMHKSLLSIVIAAAIEDGIIGSLDDPVGTYIREWAKDSRSKINLRQLLTHSSGLAHYSFGSGAPEAINLGYSSRISETALAYPADKPAGFEFNYNNVNSQIAGIALQRALNRKGLRYAEYLAERIWQPLGNRKAYLWLDRPDGNPRFFSGLEAGLDDWLKVGIMLANGGSFADQTVLQPGSVERLSDPGALNPSYGLHLWLGQHWQKQRSYGPGSALSIPHAKPYLAPDVVFFDGFGGQRVYIVPSQQLVVARAGEVDFSYDDSFILNTLLRGLIKYRAEESRKAYMGKSGKKVYDQRLEQLLQDVRSGGGGLADYEPLIEIPGAPSSRALPGEPGKAPWLDTGTREQLQKFARESNTRAMLVWQNGALVFDQYLDDTSPHSLINSRSLAKPLSVVAIGRAIETGYIESLDQAVADFIDEWQGTDKTPMTIRHLLQMSSGLAPQGNPLEPDSLMSRAYLHPYHTEVIINEYPLVHAPGSRYDYSNANGDLIAPVIERATGRAYETWLGEAVLKPIEAAGGLIWANRPGGTVHSGCCLLLPAESYLRLSILLMNDGSWDGERLLPEGFVAEMTQASSHNPHAGMGVYVAGPYIEYRGVSPDMAFGAVRHSEPYLDDSLFLFDGHGNQVSYHIPRHKLIVMRLGTSPPKGFDWDNVYLPNLLLRRMTDAGNTDLVPQTADSNDP